MEVTRRGFIGTLGAGSTVGFAGIGAAQQPSKTVKMVTRDGNYYFDPIGLQVQPGDTVTFENVSGSHSSTAYKKGTGSSKVTRIPDGAAAWNSGILTAEGATFTHTFDVEGTYDYFCIPHKALGMVGRIVVGEPGGPAQGSMPPDGDVPKSDLIVSNGSIAYDAFVSGEIDSGGVSTGGGSESGTREQQLFGGGLLGGLAVFSAIVYQITNSEGERYRVGSSKWRQKYLDR